MSLDIYTLLTLCALNVAVIALALPMAMGRPLSAASRWLPVHVGLQAVAGWAQALPAWQDGLAPAHTSLALAAVQTAAQSASLWAMSRVLEGWLGPRPGRVYSGWLALLTSLAGAAWFAHDSLRSAVVHALLAAHLLLLAWASFAPAVRRPHIHGWRQMLTVALGLLAWLTVAQPWLAAGLALMVTHIAQVLGTMALLVGWRDEADETLRNHHRRDALTGLWNRRGWHDVATPLFEQATRLKTDAVLITLDLDLFKDVNDMHGHEVGDKALTLLGSTLLAQLRPGDTAARLGGEEFAVLLMQAGPGSAVVFEQGLRTALREASREELGFSLHFSAGATRRQASHHRLDDMVQEADAALFEAKRAGRGHLRFAPSTALPEHTPAPPPPTHTPDTQEPRST
jgi:diguanylate cyclase